MCCVCDKALGLNFSAITCESCKAFFRRNALLKKKLTCPFNQHCEITILTRRFCQKCRLQKCFKVGMNKGHIMSDEDKKLKKHKIEQNRVKRKDTKIKHRKLDSSTVEHEDDATSTSTATINCDENDDSRTEPFEFHQSTSVPSVESEEPPDTTNQPPVVLTTSMIVDMIVRSPETAANAFDEYMKSSGDALKLMENIMNSQRDAMKLISHLILYPGDALKIISKVMNSPFDALTVFTKFMSSPTDSIQIISKVANSPGDVLKFMQQLMSSPGDAIDIMNKFMEQPAEALKIINKMVNSEDKLVSECGTGEDDKLSLLDSIIDSVKQNTTRHSNNEFSTNTSDDIDNFNIIENEVDNGNETSVESSFGKCIESILSEAIKLEYELNDPTIENSCNDKKLTEIESSKLMELKSASLALSNPVDVDLSNSFDSEQIKV